MKIVLVYLGKSIPNYFWDNVKHLLKIQATYDIHIVTSGYRVQCPVKNERVKYFNYKSDRKLDDILSKLEIDHEFRDGFWRYSLERLFAITQHHKNFPNEPLLHFESDILVMPNFPFRVFETLETIYWTRVDAMRDVASIISIPSNTESDSFERSMLEIVESAKSIDDMKIMSIIAHASKTKIEILPSISSSKSLMFCKQADELVLDSISIERNFDTFKGIFDPASIGIWLTGTDPRNYFGVTKRYENSHLIANGVYVNPDKAHYEIDEFGNLGFREFDTFIPIYNLHIHSKNRRYFQGSYLKQLHKDVTLSQKGKVSSTISIRVFGSLLLQNWKKGTLIHFLSWLPVVRVIKK